MDFLETLIKVSNIKLHKNPSSGSQVDARRGMERHTEANRTFLQHANMPKWKGDWEANRINAIPAHNHTSHTHRQCDRVLLSAPC
jgi:hypothetical protein